MKKYSIDKYDFKSRLTIAQIMERLNERTLKKKYLTMEFTNKDFIGKISPDKFEIFDNSFIPYGACCILQGVVTPTAEIKLTTTLHKAFRVLFIIWAVIMTLMFIISSFLNGSWDNILVFIILMTLMLPTFRLFLHVMYVLARNQGLEKLKRTLELTE